MEQGLENGVQETGATNQEQNTAAANQAAAGDGQAADGNGNIFAGNGQAAASAAGATEVTYDFTETCKNLNVEWSEEASNAYAEICKECNLTNDHANKLAAYGLKLQQDAVETVLAELDAREKGWQDEFKAAVGKDYDATLQKIGVAREWADRQFEGFTQMAIDTGCGNHPVFLKMMAKLADIVGEENGNKLNGAALGGGSMYDKTDWAKYK